MIGQSPCVVCIPTPYTGSHTRIGGGDNSGNGGAGTHDADVHGADMLVVMVMRTLMVTTVAMAGLVQPV